LEVLKNTGSTIEIALLAHALHQHRTDHAAPADRPTFIIFPVLR
jgi:hypothetical protein